MVSGPRPVATTVFAVLGIVSFGAVFYWTFTQPVNPDEMEHLHSTYLLLQGAVPYRDFWQNHAPTLWFLFAPIMAVWPVGASICYAARGIGLLGSLLVYLTAVRLANELCAAKHAQRTSFWRNAAVIAAAYWGVSIIAETPFFRTDAWMTWFALLSALASIRAEGARPGDGAQRRRLWWCCVAGILFGISLCFSTKLFPLVVALPLALLLGHGWTRVPDRSSTGNSIDRTTGISTASSIGSHLATWLRECAAYAMGIALAILPLALYLHGTGAASEFYRWVVVFNRMRSGSARGFETWWMPVLLASLAVVALLAAGTRRIGRGDAWTPRWMLLLALGCALFLYPLEARDFAYYIAPVLALAAPFLVSETWARRWPARAGRIVSAFLASAILLAGSIPAAVHLWETRQPDHHLRKNLQFIQWMVDASEGQVVQCNVPAHPIYAFDLTPFYVPWQLRYLAQTGTTRSEMLLRYLRAAPPLADQFESKKPALMHILVFRSYLSLLQQQGLIDEAGLDRIRRILVAEYREVNDTFYVRRSR